MGCVPVRIQAWYYPGMLDTLSDAATPSELGDFLRSRRLKVDPVAIGLPIGRRRRTSGLRREEVAERAGIGVDWYIRLEQGRAVSPSSTTIDALARALCLDAAEREHLRAMAARGRRGPFSRESVPDPLRRMVQALNLPAYMTGRRWDLLVWNDAADTLFGFSRIAEDDRNILLFMLTDPAARLLFGSAWAEEAQRILARFRTTYDLWSDDPMFRSLIARLRAESTEFPAWWDAHDVRNTRSGRKDLHHPQQGVVCLEYATFQVNDDPALKLAIYRPLPG